VTGRRGRKRRKLLDVLISFVLYSYKYIRLSFVFTSPFVLVILIPRSDFDIKI